MPTMAQRQRAAAAAAATAKALSSSSSAATQQRQTSLHSTIKQQSTTASSSGPKPQLRRDGSNSAKRIESEESNYSDEEDSDEDETAAAFEMDSQELWTQNYCATCDCLIEPGQGVGVKKVEEAMHSPTSSISRNSGLKSKTGTIKARPVSEGLSNGNMKRTHSAGKLHAAGVAGPLGPHKRTGSAAGRLNALSELRPTTKLNGDSNKAKMNNETSQGKRNSGLLRHDSTVSDQSAGGNNSANSSRPTSPISSHHNVSPRSKKNRIAGIAQTEEDVDETKIHSSPALYCSDRCQKIDEQRSSGLGELVYYLHQPVSPPPTSNWNVHGASSSLGYNSWSSKNLTLQTGGNNPGTPESECYCPECMDKNSASGTVPSGASDTTESSASFPYGQGGRKQRTQSGRIMTPQGLIGHGNDYFGMMGPNGQRKSISKSYQRGGNGLDTVSQASSNEASGLSSESAVSEMWEPHIKPTRQSTLRSPKATRDSHTSSTSEDAYGTATTGTVTPAATIGSPRRAESPFTLYGGIQTTSSSPLRLLRQGDHHSHPSVDVTSQYAQSPHATASGFLSRSMASENTELAASSGLTVAGVTGTSLLSSSLLERRRETSENSRMTPLRMTNSPMPMDVSRTTSAIGTLKTAQNRALSESLSQVNDRRQSTGSSSITSNANSGWLRNSISSAWNTIRGLPTATSTSDTSNHESEEDRRNSSTLYDLDSMTLMDNETDPTPKQSQIARPRTTRGDIPAFASEIGHGIIPGEEGNNNPGTHTMQEDRLSKSFASAHGSLDEERRRRRSEKERAQRHQRSKDVTVLPPLLGVSRTTSSINLQTSNKSTPRPHYSQHSSSASLTGINNRNRSGSHGQQNSYSGSFSQLNGLVRSNTPGLRSNQGLNGRMTPTIELGSSPNRMMSASSLGTSPRRGGLGWGAMTAIASPDATQTTFTPAPRPSSHASQRHRHHQSSGSSSRPHHHQSSGSSTGSNKNLVVLGHVGQLGFHPHGHGPIYGRHATTPVRSTTPRVPEDGGEMTGAALKGEEQNDSEQMYSHSLRRSSMAPPLRPRSGMMMRRQSDLQRNSAGLSPLVQQRHLSSDDVAPVKMYPVLDIPNRQPTHDRYDTNWLINGADEAVPQKETQQDHPVAPHMQPRDSQSNTHRKRLFYFDTT